MRTNCGNSYASFVLSNLPACIHNSIVHAKTWANCYYNVARASPILILLSHNEQNVYVRTAVLNKMTCAVSFQLQNFRRVLCSFLLFKFRQCEDYFEQSKPYFEPLTSAWQRCLLQREYFDFVCLHFHWVFLLCLATLFLWVQELRVRGCKFFKLLV